MDKFKILRIAKLLTLIESIKKNNEEINSVSDSFGESCCRLPFSK